MNHEFSDYYESNIKLLEKYHPEVWKKFLETPPEPLGKVFASANGSPNLSVYDADGNLLTLHNEQEPEKDSTSFLNKIPEDHKGFVSILGMGIGQGILGILQARPLLQHLVVFELEPAIFAQALHHVDLSSVLGDKRFILHVGQDPEIELILAKATRTLQLEDANIFQHIPSLKFNPSGYNKLKENLYGYINNLNVGGATTRALGRDFIKNRFKHICTIKHHRLLEQIQFKFNDAPAILVAGGPSLDKNIHLLKTIQEKAVIFAVDTVLPTLLKHDVHPHFLTSIDPKNLTYEKFADVVPQAKNIALICSSWVNLRTPKVFPASQIFWTFTARPVEAWMNNLLGGSSLTGGASTVAHLNLIAAHMLGCNPVVFIGQDLAYPSSATHAKETVLHGSAPSGIITGDRMGQMVKGIDGTMLRTDRSFLSMKQHFEAAIAKAPQTHINATEGGAHIEGTNVMTLQETIDQHCSNKLDITRRIEEYSSDLGSLNTDKLITQFSNIADRIEGLQKEIKKADKTTNSLSKELLNKKHKKKSFKSFANLPQQYQKQIRKIDACHKNLDNARDIWSILDEVTMEGLKESERLRQEIAIHENNPQKYHTWLMKNFERLNGINIIRKDCLNLLEDNLKMVLSFHQKESTYLKQIENNSQPYQNSLKLASLYMESGNYFLAKPIVEALLKETPESGELCFYLGCIAELFSEHEKATLYFEKAVKVEPALVERIDAFKKNMGDEFLEFVNYFRTLPNRDASIKYMLFKGLKYCPDHDGLNKRLRIILKTDLDSIKDNFESELHNDAKKLILEWNMKLDDPQSVLKNISTEVLGQLLLYKGKLELRDKMYLDALETFEKALQYSPQDHDLHFLKIDTCFVAQLFDNAIQSINNAIVIDSKFAAYWETIGDSLMAGGQHEDAISAYERCFMHMPENINLLKKIGDCYISCGQLEAAKASFEQLKVLMETQNQSSSDT